MRRFAKVSFVLFAAALIGLGSAQAQDDDYYEDQGYDGPRENKFAFALGAGIVNTDAGSDINYAANFRIKLGDKGSGQVEEGIVGYLEPEIGYWAQDQGFTTGGALGTLEATDFHIGIGITGVIPTRAADLYMNVGLDFHSMDVNLTNIEGAVVLPGINDGSDSGLGGHAKVGLDIYLGDNFSLLGEGGYYLVDSELAIFENQIKVHLGGRFGF